jgi:hypothetical protein
MSGSFVVTMIGDYMWQASYSGDGTNPPFTSACPDEDESFTVRPEIPRIDTVADPNGPANIGDSAKDTATLSDGFNPTGTITFDLYRNDNSCSDPTNIVFTDTVPVAGNGAYMSGSFVVTMDGDYMWQADYSGDANNLPFTSTCPDANESFTVEPEGGEGRTPGFYKNNWDSFCDQDASGPAPFGDCSWVLERGDDSFVAVFGPITIKGGNDDPSLREALSAKGGGVNALARHCVAAKLNAEHPAIDYNLSSGDVIAQCSASLASGNSQTIEDLKNQLDEFNNQGGAEDVSQHWPNK